MLLLKAVPPLRSSALVTVAAASVYGLLLWVVNFEVIAPALERDWFADADPLRNAVVHTLGFGIVLGVYLVSTLPRQGHER